MVTKLLIFAPEGLVSNLALGSLRTSHELVCISISDRYSLDFGYGDGQ